MSRVSWTPWHKVVTLREDLRSGELTLAEFAADLYGVAMDDKRTPEIYRDPAQFFALTYPTFSLRELARDVMLRVAGRSEKAIRHLELTYGGGKTHSLITLYHLHFAPERLPRLAAVEEFIRHAGIEPQRARIVVLPFDKLDVEKGMEVKAPDGSARWLRQPWSALAFQIAGVEGLRHLHADGKDEERESAPAENLLVTLLEMPARERLGTLLLLDEILTYAREKVALAPTWRDHLQNFFQYLTQAAVKVRRCAVVASLLATDPRKHDELGKQITLDLYEMFQRVAEQGIQPVGKEDVAEILRRRLFTQDSIRDRDAFRPHVVTAVKNIALLDEETRKQGGGAEDRFLSSYPFHPDLTDVLYTKWTQLEGFQRTRGVLRTFALALRDAEEWDTSPLVAPNVLLGKPSGKTLSEAARALAGIATTEEYEGKRQDWAAILEGELDMARDLQGEHPGLKNREIEQAVAATFLHSQPIGQKASSRDLLALLAQSRPDRIDLEKALLRWVEVSYFLDEGMPQKTEQRELPRFWRLGSKPNLTQMHREAMTRVPSELVEHQLVDETGKVRRLTEGASAAGVKVHLLPERPSDIEDDGEFHYAVLGPNAASDPGKPNPTAQRFINETTGSDRPRSRNRNAVVLAVPSRDGMEAARNRVHEYLAWEEVRLMLRDQPLDPLREGLLTDKVEKAKKLIPEAIRQAYCIAVTVSEKNEILGIKVQVGNEPLFTTIKKDARVRIQETAINAEALLPGGPYDLWREGETSRWIKDLVGAFASTPRLPKMLSRQAILDTLLEGCRQGLFALRLTRPDKTVRTWWRDTPDEVALRDLALEVVLPEATELTSLSPALLAPGVLPSLWNLDAITFRDFRDYFRGAVEVKIPRNGYEETQVIPRTSRETLEEAVRAAVKQGTMWLTSGPASLFAEDVPPGVLADDTVLQAPPKPILPMELIPGALEEAWSEEKTTALSIATALSRKVGKTLPWATIRDAIDGAIRSRYLEVESGQWPSDYPSAQHVKLRLPKEPPPPPDERKPVGVLTGRAELTAAQIQDLADRVADVVRTAAGHPLKFRVTIEFGDGTRRPPRQLVDAINQLLKEIAEGLALD